MQSQTSSEFQTVEETQSSIWDLESHVPKRKQRRTSALTSHQPTTPNKYINKYVWMQIRLCVNNYRCVRRLDNNTGWNCATHLLELNSNSTLFMMWLWDLQLVQQRWIAHHSHKHSSCLCAVLFWMHACSFSTIIPIKCFAISILLWRLLNQSANSD